jgi:hypothetical protein
VEHKNSKLGGFFVALADVMEIGFIPEREPSTRERRSPPQRRLQVWLRLWPFVTGGHRRLRRSQVRVFVTTRCRRDWLNRDARVDSAKGEVPTALLTQRFLMGLACAEHD